MSQKQQDVEQVTNTQIYATVTQQNTINRVQNNKTQITFTCKQFICTQTAQQCAVWYLDVAALLKFCIALAVTMWWW